MAEEQSAQRPGQERPRQRTISTLRPTTTRGTTGLAARDTLYSLAGPPETRLRPPPRHETYVDDGYRDLNPEYEREVQNPVFSLGGNLPHTVRGFMKRGGNGGKSSRVGVEKGEKGDTEAAPQVQNAEDRATRTREQVSRNNTSESLHAESPSTPSGNVGMRTLQARDQDGHALGTIGEEPVQLNEQSDDERTLAEDPANDRPFNPWAAFRRKYQDPLGEWLGVSNHVVLSKK